MSIRQHKTKTGWWVIDYYPEGRNKPRVQEAFKGTEEEARVYEKCVRGIHVSVAKTSVNPAFKDIADEFQIWAETNRSHNYQQSIKWSLKRLRLAFGVLPPSRITYQLIEQYKGNRKATPRACNQELEMLQIIINWGADPKRNYCRKLPFKIDKLQHFKNLPEPPDAGEFDRLIEEITKSFKQARATPEQKIHKLAMVMIMYETGIRWIECRHLEWDHLRESDGRLYLGRTKAGKARYTFLSPEVMELLKPIAKKTGYIFINPRTDEIYTTIGKSLRENAKKAGIKLKGTHTLRHALGTDAMDASDGDIRSTQVALGHADIKTTTIYTHTSTKRVKSLLDEVRKYRNEGRKPLNCVVTNEPDYCI